jgi:tryptophan-rich sensory protein
MWMSPKQRLAQVLAAVSTFAVTMFYARAAEKVDERSAKLVAPYAGWVGFANLLNTELWAKNRGKGRAKAATVH